jgi:hypothetical protein
VAVPEAPAADSLYAPPANNLRTTSLAIEFGDRVPPTSQKCRSELVLSVQEDAFRGGSSLASAPGKWPTDRCRLQHAAHLAPPRGIGSTRPNGTDSRAAQRRSVARRPTRNPHHVADVAGTHDAAELVDGRQLWHRRDQRRWLREVYDAAGLLICWVDAGTSSGWHSHNATTSTY